jgi:hypothetical protein
MVVVLMRYLLLSTDHLICPWVSVLLMDYLLPAIDKSRYQSLFMTDLNCSHLTYESWITVLVKATLGNTLFYWNYVCVALMLAETWIICNIFIIIILYGENKLFLKLETTNQYEVVNTIQYKPFSSTCVLVYLSVIGVCHVHSMVFGGCVSVDDLCIELCWYMWFLWWCLVVIVYPFFKLTKIVQLIENVTLYKLREVENVEVSNGCLSGKQTNFFFERACR